MPVPAWDRTIAGGLSFRRYRSPSPPASQSCRGSGGRSSRCMAPRRVYRRTGPLLQFHYRRSWSDDVPECCRVRCASCTKSGSSVSGGYWTSSMAASQLGSRRDLSDGQRPLRGVRHRAEAARSWQVEMVCSCDRRTCRHGWLGMQSRRRAIQGGARAVSPAMRLSLTLSQVAAGAV